MNTAQQPLRLGMKGPEVKGLQRRLNELGESLLASGQFGPRTLEAVRRFQTVKGIRPADGVVDEGTRKALEQTAAEGTSRRMLSTPETVEWFDPSAQRPMERQAAPPQSVQLVLSDGRALAVEDATGEVRTAYESFRQGPANAARDNAVLDLNRELVRLSRKGFYTVDDRHMLAQLLKPLFGALGLPPVLEIRGEERQPAVRVEDPGVNPTAPSR
jgi:hypothetical protein